MLDQRNTPGMSASSPQTTSMTARLLTALAAFVFGSIVGALYTISTNGTGPEAGLNAMFNFLILFPLLACVSGIIGFMLEEKTVGFWFRTAAIFFASLNVGMFLSLLFH